MDALTAARETIEYAKQEGYDNIDFEIENVDFDHLESMLSRMKEGNFSYGKQCRWLGYIQGVLVANSCLSLDVCKDINRRNATK